MLHVDMVHHDVATIHFAVCVFFLFFLNVAIFGSAEKQCLRHADMK